MSQGFRLISPNLGQQVLGNGTADQYRFTMRCFAFDNIVIQFARTAHELKERLKKKMTKNLILEFISTKKYLILN